MSAKERLLETGLREAISDMEFILQHAHKEPVAWAYYWSDGGLCSVESRRRDPQDNIPPIEVPLYATELPLRQVAESALETARLYLEAATENVR